MSQVIIVEGCDFTGKTTLINRLAKEIGALTIKASIPHSRKEVYDWVDFVKSWTHGPVICDRSPLISDPIYSQVLGRLTIVNEEMSRVLLKSLNPIIVFCDPGLHQVLECNNEQMTGVKGNLQGIYRRYKGWQSNPHPFTIIAYDYLQDPEAYQSLKGFIENECLGDLADHETVAVDTFHTKFGMPPYPQSWDPSVAEFRLKFLREEIEEFADAILLEDNKVKAFDALLDLVYVAKGTALLMGISSTQWARGFKAVQTANMTKERVASADQSKRGHSFDVKKPPGWVGPEEELRRILGNSK